VAYASQDQIESAAGGAELLVQIADWDADGVVDAAAITWAQGAADSWINSFAGGPLGSPSLILQMYAADEAVYQLRSKRRALTTDDETKRVDRLAWMQMLAKGQVRAELPAARTSAGAGPVDNRTDARDKLKGFI
jgi:phage gp36-like protein